MERESPRAALGFSVRDVLRRLSRVRRRIRAVLAVTGAARWILAAVAALVAFFVLDWQLELPLDVRRFLRLGLLDRPPDLAVPIWIFALAVSAALTVGAMRARNGAAPIFAFLTAGVFGLLAWFAFRSLVPMGVALSEQDLALAVERRHRHLQDRLAAALDFERELASPSREESPAMMRAVVQDAVREVEGLEFARVVSARRALRWGGGALAALAAAAALVALWSEPFGIWAERSLLLRDRPWPRDTVLVAVRIVDGAVVPHDPTVPFLAPVGRTLIVHAQARGDVPREVQFVDRLPGAAPMPRRMFPVEDRPGMFAVEIRDVRRPFSFVLRGGDDDDEEPEYRVEVTVPPQVLEASMRVDFPDYLRREPATMPAGDVEIPEGSTVTVTFGADVDVVEARATLGDRSVAATPVTGGPDAPGGDEKTSGLFRFSFQPERTTRWSVLVRTDAGHESDPSRTSYETRVVPDRPPRVEWRHPRGPVETSLGGRVPLLASVVDDHGIASVRLEVRSAEQTLLDVPLVPWTGRAPEDEDAAPARGAPREALDGALGRPTVGVYVPLEVGALAFADGAPLVAPARLSVRLVATDTRGQTKEGTWTPLDVYRAPDLERSLATRRSVVRKDVDALLAEQMQRREELASLAAGTLGNAERDRLRTLQYAQARTNQEVNRAVRGLVQVFNDYVYDRLGAENPNEKILAIMDAHHRRTYGALPADAEGGSAGTDVALGGPVLGDPVLGDPVLGDPVFPYLLYDSIVDAWRRKTIFDTGVLDRVLSVLAEALQAGERDAPRAQEAMAAAATGDAAATANALRAMDALIGSLTRLRDAMSGWQRLNDLVLDLRRIIEAQEALNDRMTNRESRPAGTPPPSERDER